MQKIESSGEPGGENPAQPLIFAGREYLSWLQIERGAAKNTVDAYRRALVKYIDYLIDSGVESPEAIDREDVTGFVSFVSGGEGGNLSQRSVAQLFSAVRMFHRFLTLEGFSSTDPSTVLSAPRIPMRLPKALSREQVEKLICAPEGGAPMERRDRTILELLYATGMRISELTGMDLGDIDLEERFVRCMGKGSKWRVIPYGRRTSEELVEYLDYARPEIVKDARQNALILNMNGGRLTRQGCWKVIRKRAREVELQELVTPHVLRHTFATHLLEGGANLLVVQELLGHVSISTTQIYTEVTKDHMREVYMKTHPRAL